MSKDSRLVYSTETGRVKDDPRPSAPASPAGDGVVRLKRESKGRGGKTVTLVTGLSLAPAPLKALATELKKLCGTGGSLKDGVIEIQGEQREKIKPFLETKGFTVKLAGG